jgi:beta-barrel assembly-enhancing protease
MHRHRLKRRRFVKLAAGGCGRILLLSLGIGIITVFSSARIRSWAFGIFTSAWSHVPKQVQLPKVIKIPAGLGLPESVRIPQFPNLFTLSPQEQILLGNEVAQNQGFESDSFMDAGINSVGVRLVRALPNDYRGPAESGGWDWQFKGLRTKDGSVNAVALPGGKIYLYDGLIKLMGDDPNQLAAVIGHEMGHVVKEHTAKQMLTQGLLQKASELILQNSSGEGDGGQSEIIKALAAQMGMQITQMQLSQSAEYQADSIGLQFMSAANYDPAAFLDMLSKLDRISTQRKSILTGVFSTHPPTNRRMREIQKLLKPPAATANW